MHGTAQCIHGIWRRPLLTDAKIKAAKPGDKPHKLGDSGQFYRHDTRRGTRGA